MELKLALLTQPDVAIFQVEPQQDVMIDPCDWQVTPIHSETLAADSARDGILDGVFILKAAFVTPGGEKKYGYVDVVMPERLSDTAYFVEGNDVSRTSEWELKNWGVPLVAIEGFGNYELFYSRVDPEIGLEVLRKGLAIAKKKLNIATDMGYILRDEKRYREALDAFTLAIELGEASGQASEPYFQYYYQERDSLLEKLAAPPREQNHT